MKREILEVVSALALSVFWVGSLRSADDAVGLVNPQHGSASVEGEDSPYYYFKAKIEASVETNLVFTINTCILVGNDGENYTNCWIHVAGASAGLEETKTAPVWIRTLSVLEGATTSKPAAKWNTSRPDGEKGAITYRIPKGGFVQLNFLWPVPKGFEPKHLILLDLVDLAL